MSTKASQLGGVASKGKERSCARERDHKTIENALMQVNMCVSRITVCQPITLALYMTLCNTVTSGTAPAVGEWVLCGLWYGTNDGTVLRCALTRETGRETKSRKWHACGCVHAPSYHPPSAPPQS